MEIDFTKGDGLIPVIIQNFNTSQVLMLGYMNDEAFHKTKAEKKVTFLAEARTDYGPKVKNPETF